jgi:hypothetical protein
MATVTPTLTISSSDALVDTLSLSVNKALSISGESQYGKKLTTGSLVTLLSDAAAGGFGSSLVYLKNLSGNTDARASTPSGGIIISLDAVESMEIAAGEFCLIPWKGLQDIKVKHNGAGSAPYVEFAVFEF